MELPEEKRPREKNEIENQELKENLANLALDLLREGEDYRELAYAQCQFGYLFVIEDHGLEALFKITTDKGTAYFAAQKQSLLRLCFTEELFQNAAETFLSLHQ